MKFAPLLLLAGCAAAPPPEPPRRVPPAVSCPGRVVVPPAPRAPRSIEAIARWGTALDAALVKSEAARAACERSLDLLHEWIAAHD